MVVLEPLEPTVDVLVYYHDPAFAHHTPGDQAQVGGGVAHQCQVVCATRHVIGQGEYDTVVVDRNDDVVDVRLFLPE